MNRRTLGSQGLSVSEIGLGCMGMSEFYGPADQQECRRTLQRAVERGITLFDTADVYGCGENERLLGCVLREVRNQVVIATKVGLLRSPEGKFYGLCGRPEYIVHACEASLARLGTDTIDLLYLHRVDRKVPIEDTVGAMAELVQTGKVRFLGLSEAAAETVRRAHVVHPISALQDEYSLWSREPEEEVLPVCRELGIGLMAYSPLGRGFLSGGVVSRDSLAPQDARLRHPRFKEENLGRNVRLLAAVGEVARERGCSLAQVALSWLLFKGDDIVPIPGTKRTRFLEENAAAGEILLSPKDRKKIDQAFPPGVAWGKRYPKFEMRFVNT
jgi:aryl-alcohol dehydrogenase-like predicted oxidoreductase